MGIIQKIKSFFRRLQQEDPPDRGKKPKSEKKKSPTKPEESPPENQEKPAEPPPPRGRKSPPQRRSEPAEPDESPAERETDEPDRVRKEEPKSEQNKTPQKYLTIGFDWGTSCSKVVIREPYGPSQPAYLVDFGDLGDASISQLLPSRLFLGENGEASLDDCQSELSVTDLKVRLMQDPDKPVPDCDGARPRELAALYIGAGLRYARRWFLQTHGDVYGNSEITWELNLGIPAASHDEEEICDAFEAIARAAWGLSQQASPTLQDAKNAFHADDEDRFDPGIHPDLVSVVPEVAAQVAGYAQSDLRRPGLHVLVDVGAATLDLAGFILTDDEGEDRYSILEAAVRPLGAYRLEQERIKSLKELGRRLFRSEEKRDQWALQMEKRCQDPMRKVPSDIREYYPQDLRGKITLEQRNEVDEDFRHECYKSCRALVADIKLNRAPNARMLGRGLPIFLAGGGHRVGVYHDALAKLEGYRERHWSRSTSPFHVRTLPSLEDLIDADVDEEHRHRFSVAYGLSFPKMDIGYVRPPHNIPNVGQLWTRGTPSFNYQDTKAWT